MGARTVEGHSEKTAQGTRSRTRSRSSTLAQRLLRRLGAILLSHSPSANDPISQENPLTGKPDARSGPVRFGGGGRSIPRPYPYPIATEFFRLMLMGINTMTFVALFLAWG